MSSEIIVGVAGAVPVAGGLLSKVVAEVFPHQDDTSKLWDQIAPLAKALVQEELGNFDRKLLEDMQKGLQNLIDNWQDAPADRRKAKFDALDAFFSEKEPRYSAAGTTTELVHLPFLPVIGSMYLSYLYDTAFNYPESTGENNKDTAFDLVRLWNKVGEYKAELRDMREACIKKRTDCVSVDPGWTGYDSQMGIMITDTFYDKSDQRRQGLELGIYQDQEQRAANMLSDWRMRVLDEFLKGLDTMCKPADAWHALERAVIVKLLACQDPVTVDEANVQEILRVFDADADPNNEEASNHDEWPRVDELVYVKDGDYVNVSVSNNEVLGLSFRAKP